MNSILSSNQKDCDESRLKDETMRHLEGTLSELKNEIENSRKRQSKKQSKSYMGKLTQCRTLWSRIRRRWCTNISRILHLLLF
eukprot:3258090-Ditylum_brightwellii.AAC.1